MVTTAEYLAQLAFVPTGVAALVGAWIALRKWGTVDRKTAEVSTLVQTIETIQSDYARLKEDVRDLRDQLDESVGRIRVLEAEHGEDARTINRLRSEIARWRSFSRRLLTYIEEHAKTDAPPPPAAPPDDNTDYYSNRSGSIKPGSDEASAQPRT